MSGVGRLAYVVVDAHDPARLAAFYGPLLGVGVHWAHEGGQWVVLAPPAPGATTMLFQRVPDPTPGKNRLHIDLHVPDLESATDRAEELGATRDRDVRELGLHWRLMRDPEGNVFCLVHHPEEAE